MWLASRCTKNPTLMGCGLPAEPASAAEVPAAEDADAALALVPAAAVLAGPEAPEGPPEWRRRLAGGCPAAGPSPEGPVSGGGGRGGGGGEEAAAGRS